MAVADVAVELIAGAGFRFDFAAGGRCPGAVEDDGGVGFDADETLVATADEVAEDVCDATATEAWEGVVGVPAGWVVGTVLDVDVGDGRFDCLVEFPWILHVGWVVAVHVEDGIAGIEDPAEARDFLEAAQGVTDAHASVIHAVFVDHDETGVVKAALQFAEAAEAFGFLLVREVVAVFVLEDSVAHDADEAGAEPLHARDGTFGALECR